MADTDQSSSEWLVHPLLQSARGYLTDEDYFAVEATLGEAVECAKDLETERDRLRAENDWLREEMGRRDGFFYQIQKVSREYEERLESAAASTTKEVSDA